MNIDLDAIRSLLQDREMLCEDVASRAQTAQLRSIRAESKLGRMNKAKVNTLTLERLEREATGFNVQAEQFGRLFSTLRCKAE